MAHQPASAAGTTFLEAFAGAVAGRRTIVRRGHRTVAVVPVDDLELLDRIENLLDVELARDSLAEAREQGTSSLDLVRASLGL